MSRESAISELQVEELVEAIRMSRPSPGAGAAGAVALALAAACAGKAVTISLKHKPDDGKLKAAAEGFVEIARRALSGADADADGFEAFMRKRSAALADRLIQTDRRIVDLCTALKALTDEIQSAIEPALAGDLFAARRLADAAHAIESRNITEITDSAPVDRP